MISATFTFYVNGDSYHELKANADAVVVELLKDEDDFENEDIQNMEDFEAVYSVDYELVIDENQDMEVDSDYQAEVTARIKPRR